MFSKELSGQFRKEYKEKIIYELFGNLSQC